MPFLLAILSSVLYGTADFLGGFGSRRAPVVTVTLWSQALGLIALLAVAPFIPGVARNVDLMWGVGAGITGGLGVWLLYRALATGTVSIAAPLISMIALLVPVTVGLLSGERPGVLALAGVGVGVLAVVLISGGGSHTEAGNDAPARMSRGALLSAIASGLLVGGFLVCLGQIPGGAGLWPLVSARATGTCLIGLILLLQRAPARAPTAAVPAIVGAGVADVAANLCYVEAAAHGPLSIVATIVSLAPAATVLLAQIVFRERLSTAQKVGVGFALLAVFLLARGSAH